ncbi:MAG TPA: AgmX/PglI C-terminal domain-containing protein [Polyangia bacterium]|nr:AgmX/PglI C-terminal domain-containing protein [Polyangia bacterium]
MEPIDELIRAAAPRAPRGLADAVERRLGARRRTQRGFVAAGVLVAAAAMLVLWLVRPTAPVPRPSAWIAVSARATTADGKPVAAGQPLTAGALVRVGDGGIALLERAVAIASAGAHAQVMLGSQSEARVGDGAIELLSGQARLEGPEARVTGDVAEVTTLGASAAATVDLRRNPMIKASLPKTAALAALLSVAVLDGGARVAAKGHAPILLAKNDRTLVAPKLPPLTTRAPAARPAAKPVAKPAPTPAPAPTPTANARPTATATGQLDKDVIRTAVQDHLPELRTCYDRVLARSPKLAGKLVVRMTLVTKDGQSTVSEAEIQPTDDGDLDSIPMQTCVLQAVSQWRFPPSADGGDVVVSYPFLFATADDGE